MKNLILLSSFILLTTFSNAQLCLDVTGKGQFNSTWLFNQNISDLGEEQDYAAGWGSNFGMGLGLRIGVISFCMESNWGHHNGEYAGTRFGQNYTSKVDLKTVQIPLFIRLQNEGGAYFELGAQYNKIKSASYSREIWLPVIANDVSSYYAKSYTSAFIGFGVHTPIVKSLPISLLFGVRLNYGLKDAKGVDALGNSLDNSLLYSTYRKTNSAAAGLNLGITYTIDTKKKK